MATGFLAHLDGRDTRAIEKIRQTYFQDSKAAAAKFAINVVMGRCPDASRISTKTRKECKELEDDQGTYQLRLGDVARVNLSTLTTALAFDSDSETLRFCLRHAAERAETATVKS